MPCKSSKSLERVLVSDDDLVGRRAARQSHLRTEGNRDRRSEVVEQAGLHPPQRDFTSRFRLLDEETGSHQALSAEVGTYPEPVTKIPLCRLRRADLVQLGVQIELRDPG